jgi:uncharacterized protein
MTDRRRALEPVLRRSLDHFRVVAVVGPRQVGKSTLVRTLPGRHYVTLDDLGALGAAMADPRGFVERLPLPATIDEVQRAPALLLAIKEVVDQEKRPGSFVLTGSSRIDTLRGIRETLAGRIALLRLRPMTHLELAGTPDADPIGRLFAFDDVKAAASSFARLGEGLAVRPQDLLAGGFPEPALRLDPRGQREWQHEYRKSVIERDVPAILRIEDVPAFARLFSICGASTAGLLNVSKAARDTGVSVDTANRWISVLETTFVVERRQPYFRNVRKRLVKSPKLYLSDSGLAASILETDDWRDAVERAHAGAILETWMHANLAALAERSEPETRLHFYRTHSQAEVDFVLIRGKRLVGIDVKAASSVRPADAKGIEDLAMQFPKECPFGIVLYRGRTVLPLAEHTVAVPLSTFFAG